MNRQMKNDRGSCQLREIAVQKKTTPKPAFSCCNTFLDIRNETCKYKSFPKDSFYFSQIAWSLVNGNQVLSWGGRTYCGFVLMSDFQPCLCYFLPLCSWTRSFTSLIYTFLHSEREMITGCMFGLFWRFYCDCT